MADDIPHHQEVVRQSHVGDCAEFVVESNANVVTERVTVAVARALVGQFAQVRGGAFLVRSLRILIGQGEFRQCVVVELDRDVGPFGDHERVVARLRELAKEVAHLRGGLEVVLVALEAKTIRIRDSRTSANTQKGVMHFGVLVAHVVQVVRRE